MTIKSSLRFIYIFGGSGLLWGVARFLCNAHFSLLQICTWHQVSQTHSVFIWELMFHTNTLIKIFLTIPHTIQKYKKMAGQNTFHILVLNDFNMIGEH